MKCSMLFAITMVSMLSVAHADSTNPIKKVLQMMTHLQDKIIAQGTKEQKLYEEKTEFCQERSKKLAFEIKTGKAEVAELKATIDQQTAAISKSQAKIEDLSGDISTYEADLSAAKAVRQKEAADFTAEEKESQEVIDSLDRAIAVLGREMKKHGASMLQLQSAQTVTQALSVLVQGAAISSEDSSRLTSLMQENSMMQEADFDDDSEFSFGAPAASATKGHSAGIIQLMEGLLEKAEEQLAKARKAEANSAHNFNMVSQSLTDQMKYANKDLADTKVALSEAQEKKASATGDLVVTSKDLAGDVAGKEALHQDCMSAAQEFELETRSRDEEVKAVATAKKIIEESTGGAEKQTYGLNQVALLELGSSTNTANFKAVRLIRDLAEKQGSDSLAQLASRMASIMRMDFSTGQDPFGKVKDLINGMVAKLEKEAAEEATQKAYCDKEMKETAEKMEEKDTEVRSLSTKKDQKASASGKLKQEVSTLQEEMASMTKDFGEVTKIRQEEKAAFQKNKQELDQGLKGVQMAAAVLRDYYAKGDKKHDTGASEGMGGNILNLLEVVESDMTKGISELVATEDLAVRKYEQFAEANKLDMVKKGQDEKHKTKEFKGLDKVTAEVASDLSGVQDESDAIHEYDKKIKKSCIAKPDPYEEKKKRREAEIAGLKEALGILKEQTSLLQVSKRTLRGAHGSSGRAQ